MQDRVIAAMIREMELKAPYWKDATFNTLYFGGGTPSILNPKLLSELIISIKKYFHTEFSEITLEANPDDMQDPGLLQFWKDIGINRLSIGIQSFRDEDLTWMNRAHSSTEAHKALELALKTGWNNLSIDLIYGTPGMSNDIWEEQLNILFSYNIPHFSAYALTVETRTPLDRLIKMGRYAAPEDEQCREQFDLLMDLSAMNGYKHYEISNFCKEGFESNHNRAYWQRKAYLGIGPSAHEFNEPVRRWNHRSNTRYTEALEQGQSFSEEEILRQRDRINERIMTQLRMDSGLNLNSLMQEEGWMPDAPWKDSLAGFIQAGHLREQGQAYILTRSGKHLADYIASELFLLPETQP